jgi:hypothetical protein
LAGDFNVVPTDFDIYNPVLLGQRFVEIDAFRRLQGVVDFSKHGEAIVATPFV